MDNFVVISGCSGGGKSTLLSELHRRGHAVVEEPGKRIIEEEALSRGHCVPWIDMVSFLRRAIDVALDDHANANADRGKWVFFDRGLIDAAAALQELTGEAVLSTLGNRYRYHPSVFLAPPWPEIYVQDSGWHHSMRAYVTVSGI